MSVRTPRPGPRAVAACVLLGVVSLATAASADARTIDVTGTLRDDRGRAIGDGKVYALTGVDRAGRPEAVATDTVRTADDGRFRLDDVLVPAASDTGDRGTRLVAVGSATHMSAEHPGFARAMRATPPGGTLRADLTARTRDATIRGRLTVRGGASPAGGTVLVMSAGDSWHVEADDEGRYSVLVPSGRIRIRAESTYGIWTVWPDLPSVRDDRVETLAYGQTRTMDFSMRPRMARDADDEYGSPVPGYLGKGNDPPSGRRYPRDPYRSVTVVRGPVVDVGTPTQEFTPDPSGEITTWPGWPLSVTVRVANTGDDALWLDGGRIEGPDAATFRCDDGRISLPPPGQTGATSAPASCDDLYVGPGTSRTIRLIGRPDRDADRYEVALVARTNTRSGVLRVPVRIRRLRGPAPAATPASLVAGGGASTAGARVRVALRRTRLRATFPRAGSATFRLFRRVGARRPRWRPVRTVRLRATRAGVRTARLRRLPPGRYRVRTVARLGGTTTARVTTHRVARR